MSGVARALLAIGLTALGFGASSGLGTAWPLAWVAPLPVLVIALDARARTAFCVAFAAGLLGGLGLTRAYGPIAAVFGLPSGLIFGLAVLVLRCCAARLPAWAAACAYAAAVTSLEFLYSLVSPNGTALGSAYTQVDVLPVLQLASVAGLWGIAFVLALVPASAALCWRDRSMRPLLPAVALVLAVVGWGTLRLADAAPSPAVTVGLAAADQGLPDAAFMPDRATAVARANGYATRIATLADRGAQVVVLPEKPIAVAGDTGDAVVSELAAAARANSVTVVAGLNRIGTNPRRNVAVVIGPDGRVAAEYEKRHRVPGFESRYGRGDRSVAFDAAGARWGVAICKDLDFPATMREYGRLGVRYLAVPAWDFVADGRMHGRMAVVRGVENGYSIARSAQQGLVTLSDGYGRIVAEDSSPADPLLVAGLPPGPGPTFYTRHGDWFAWLCVGAVASLLAAAIARRRRPGAD
ncbi:MAG: nitrilase-related carbon-nitrogen hydrolase [Steroidobacteraceae bacterium]